MISGRRCLFPGDQRRVGHTGWCWPRCIPPAAGHIMRERQRVWLVLFFLSSLARKSWLSNSTNQTRVEESYTEGTMKGRRPCLPRTTVFIRGQHEVEKSQLIYNQWCWLPGWKYWKSFFYIYPLCKPFINARLFKYKSKMKFSIVINAFK